MEFCKIFNERCNFKIAYTVDLLESMKKNPKNYEREWAIWQDMVKEIADDYEGKNNYFNWADTLSPWKME